MNTLNELVGAESAIALANDVVATSIDTNNILASNHVKYAFRAHYANVATGINGIEQLILAILKDNGAIFPTNVGETTFRSMAVKSAMYSEEIIAKVQDTFGFDRYPYNTIHTYLSVFMCKNKKTVCKIKLTNAEDSQRECCKPRVKWYVVQ